MRLTLLVLMPSASAIAIPFRPSAGCSGMRAPWKSWFVSLRPGSECCPIEIAKSRRISSPNSSPQSPGAPPCKAEPQFTLLLADCEPSRRLDGITLGPGAHMRRVERQADECDAADEIADNSRNLVPEHVVHQREFAAQHQARREQVHVHDGMLEAHVEEQHDRH